MSTPHAATNLISAIMKHRLSIKTTINVDRIQQSSPLNRSLDALRESAALAIQDNLNISTNIRINTTLNLHKTVFFKEEAQDPTQLHYPAIIVANTPDSVRIIGQLAALKDRAKTLSDQVNHVSETLINLITIDTAATGHIRPDTEDLCHKFLSTPPSSFLK